MSIINLKTNKVSATKFTSAEFKARSSISGVINGFNGPSSILLSRYFAYVTNYGLGEQDASGNTINVVDLKINQSIDTIKVDLAPAALALSPCEKYLYCMCYVDGNPGTAILDIISTITADYKIIRNCDRLLILFPDSFGAFGIALSVDGCYAYVPNFGSNDFSPYGTSVSVVNLKERHIVKNIEVGIQPAGIAVSNYNTLYAKTNF